MVGATATLPNSSKSPLFPSHTSSTPHCTMYLPTNFLLCFVALAQVTLTVGVSEHIIKPKSGATWIVGETEEVTWETKNIPSHAKGMIFVTERIYGHREPYPLKDNIELKKGYAKVTVPDIEDDVTLYGAQFNLRSLPSAPLCCVGTGANTRKMRYFSLTDIDNSGGIRYSGPRQWGADQDQEGGQLNLVKDTLPGLPLAPFFPVTLPPGMVEDLAGRQHHCQWAGLKIMACSLLSSNPFFFPFVYLSF
ncbi:hypothetical protein BC826DRAFT_1033125 [Russula brevipes]|nr:hypothetical protein BC826DRAFT_1033125 [Russula brevipes]